MNFFYKCNIIVTFCQIRHCQDKYQIDLDNQLIKDSILIFVDRLRFEKNTSIIPEH